MLLLAVVSGGTMVVVGRRRNEAASERTATHGAGRSPAKRSARDHVAIARLTDNSPGALTGCSHAATHAQRVAAATGRSWLIAWSPALWRPARYAAHRPALVRVGSDVAAALSAYFLGSVPQGP
jgi:hypothetical protein